MYMAQLAKCAGVFNQCLGTMQHWDQSHSITDGRQVVSPLTPSPHTYSIVEYAINSLT